MIWHTSHSGRAAISFIRSASPANLHTNRTFPPQLSGSQADLRHDLYHTYATYAMGVPFGVCCPAPRIDDDDAEEAHVVHELETDSLDDLPGVTSVMAPGHFFVPLIAQCQMAHTFPRCRVVSPVEYCRIGLWTF